MARDRSRDDRDDQDDRRPDDAPDDNDAPDDDDSNDHDDDSDDNDDDDGPDEHAREIADLKRQLRNSKRTIRRLKTGAGERRPAGRQDDRADQGDRDDDQRDRRREEREARSERRVLVAQAEAALLRAGADPELADMLAEKVKERDVDFDDDDRPDFADWIEQIREDRPGVFRSRSARRRTDDDDDESRPRRRAVPLDQGAASRGTRSRDGDLSFGQRAILAGRRADGLETSRRRRR